jgi:hypothetical protein
MRTPSNHCSRHIARIASPGRIRALGLVPASLAIVTLVVGPARAQPPASDYRWDELQRQGRVTAGTVLPPEAGSSFHRLKVESASSAPSVATVLTIEAPRITGPRYVLSGQVRYEGVEGTGYLEMWSYFPGGGQYFTRTLGKEGPMMKLSGTAEWRAFALPFNASGQPPPMRLVVNVVLEGRGTVYVSELTLRDQAQADRSSPADGGIDRLAGFAGGIAGGIIGSAGALIGVLAALGRARRFVIALAVMLAAAGAVMCLTGIAAISSGRAPSALPLLLVGFLASVLPLALLPTIRRRYEEIEIRAMRAHDVG